MLEDAMEEENGNSNINNSDTNITRLTKDILYMSRLAFEKFL